jgi:hypothetical protein
MTAGYRRYKRYRVENMNMRAKTLFAADAELLNMSMGGACIRTVQSLKESEKQLLRLRSEESPLTLPCSLVWQSMSGDAPKSAEKSVPVYKAGVSFSGIPSDKLVKLKDFMRRSGSPCEERISDAYKPSLLRFQIHTGNKALMYYTSASPVRKIGLGGMLVELHFDVQPERVFLMELSVPDDNPPMRFRGRIASRLPVSGGRLGRFDVGIEFLDMGLADKFRLSKFLLFSKVPFEK